MAVGGSGERSDARDAPAGIYAGLLGAILLVVLAASFAKADLTRNDFERFDDLRLSFGFFALFVGLCAVYGTFYRRRPPLSLSLALWSGVAFQLLMIASFPVGSRDVFGYAFFGRMLGTHGADPFLVSASALPNDPWLPYTTRLMTQPVTAYGPLFLLETWLLARLGGDSMWLTVWLYKVLAAGLSFGCVGVLVAIVGREPERTTPVAWLAALLAWNPLVLFEAAGAAHNDIAMALLLLVAVWCHARGRDAGAMAVIAFAFWYKWYSILFVPAFLIERWKSGGPAAASRDVAILAVAAIVLGGLLFAPFPGAPAAVLARLLDPEKMRGIFPTELSPILAGLFWSLRALGLFDTDFGFRLFDLTRYALFAVGAGLVCLRQWRAPASPRAMVEACCLLGLAFFLLLITQLWPWHLMVVIALALATGREPYLWIAVTLTVLGLLSYLLTFAIATLMLAAIAGSLWVLRRRRLQPA